MTLDSQFLTWLNQQAAEMNRAGDVQGCPRETKMLEVWKRERPEMYRRLGNLAPRLAFVLNEKRYQAMRQYVRAGWPLTDAEEQATREWCLMEPEDHANPYPPLFAQTSTSTIPTD